MLLCLFLVASVASLLCDEQPVLYHGHIIDPYLNPPSSHVLEEWVYFDTSGDPNPIPHELNLVYGEERCWTRIELPGVLDKPRACSYYTKQGGAGKAAVEELGCREWSPPFLINADTSREFLESTSHELCRRRLGQIES